MRRKGQTDPNLSSNTSLKTRAKWLINPAQPIFRRLVVMLILALTITSKEKSRIFRICSKGRK